MIKTNPTLFIKTTRNNPFGGDKNKDKNEKDKPKEENKKEEDKKQESKTNEDKLLERKELSTATKAKMDNKTLDTIFLEWNDKLEKQTKDFKAQATKLK